MHDTQQAFSFGHSQMHWIIANEQVKLAQTMKDEYPNLYGWHPAMVAIIFASMSSEAFINELSWFVHDQCNPLFPSRTADAKKLFDACALGIQLEADHAGIVCKYLAISAVLPGESLRRGHEPLASLKTLFQIRNDLVHPKVKACPKYMKFFYDKKMTCERTGEIPPKTAWQNHIQTPEIGQWACNASLKTIQHIIKQINKATSFSEPLAYTLSHITQYWDRAETK